MVGAKPYFVHFKAYIQRVWKSISDFEMYSREKGFFVINFKESKDIDIIIKNGPYCYDGRLIILRRWSSDLKMDRDLLTTMQIYVRLPSVNIML